MFSATSFIVLIFTFGSVKYFDLILGHSMSIGIGVPFFHVVTSCFHVSS